MPTTEARVSQSTAAKHGRPKTTSRPRSFTTSLWTTRSLITFTARNRTIRTSASPAAADSGVIGREDWFVAGGGECGFVVPDPRDWHIIYSNSEGYIYRYDKNKGGRAGRQSVFRSIIPDMALSILLIAFSGSRRSCFHRTTRTCSTPPPNAFSNRPITDKAGRKSAVISRATTNRNNSQAAVR